jgi:2-dehydro-3-deoxyglucarate aldolase
MMPTPYSAFPNRFRQDLIAGKRLIGCWASLGSPITTEVLGIAGFDWILLDSEHAPNDVLTLVPQLMALKDSVSAPVVRPASNDVVLIKRLLDAGFHNFLIPYVETVEEARRAVTATRYPPAGIRGVSVSHRSNRYGSVPDYFKIVNDQIAVMVQIESRAGVDAVHEIASVDGIDGLFIGPGDLAAAYGQLGNPSHPQVQDAMSRVYEAGKAAGKPVGTLAPVEADARRYMDRGASFVAVGSDLGLLRMGSQALRDKFRDSSAGPIAAQY